MRLLKAVAGSVLWLVAGNLSVQTNLRREAEERGVEPSRLVFAPRLAYADHLVTPLGSGLQCCILFCKFMCEGIKGTQPFYTPDYPQAGRIRSTRAPACRSSLDFAALRSGRTVDTFASPTIRIESEARAQSHDLPVVRHRPLPPPYRIGLRHEAGALSARRAAGEFRRSARRFIGFWLPPASISAIMRCKCNARNSP